jgi:hypothetical protein
MQRRCQRSPSSWRYRAAIFHWMETAPVVEFEMPVVL